jgi:hypothetical protein
MVTVFDPIDGSSTHDNAVLVVDNVVLDTNEVFDLLKLTIVQLRLFCKIWVLATVALCLSLTVVRCLQLISIDVKKGRNNKSIELCSSQ